MKKLIFFRFLESPFFLACTLGLILKVYFMFQVNFHVDELIHSWVYYFIGNITELLRHIKDHDTQMPLFYIMSKIFFVEGLSYKWFLRLPSFFLVLTGIVYFYFSVKNNFSLLHAKLSAALLMLSAPQIIISTTFRPYGVFLFCALMFYAQLFPILRGDHSTKRLVWLSVYAIALSYSHYFGILFCGLFILFFARTILRDKRKIIATAILVLTLIPFFMDILRDLGTFHSYRKPIDGLKVYNFISYYSGGVLFVVALFFVVAKAIKQKFKVSKTNLLLLYLIISTYLISIIKSLVSTPVFEARYFIHLAPLFYLLMSDLLIGLKINVKKSVVYLIISILCTFSVVQIHNFSNQTENEAYEQYLYSKDIFLKDDKSIFILKSFRGCPLAYFRQIMPKDRVQCEHFWSKKVDQRFIDNNRDKNIYLVTPKNVSLLNN